MFVFFCGCCLCFVCATFVWFDISWENPHSYLYCSLYAFFYVFFLSFLSPVLLVCCLLVCFFLAWFGFAGCVLCEQLVRVRGLKKPGGSDLLSSACLHTPLDLMTSSSSQPPYPSSSPRPPHALTHSTVYPHAPFSRSHNLTMFSILCPHMLD